VRHVPEGKLRRLIDEPFAVADADANHVVGCERCRLLRQRIAEDAAAASALLARPQPLPDVDLAWRRLQGSGARPARSRPARETMPTGRRWRLVGIPLPSAAVLVTVAVVVAGATTAAVLAAVRAPARATRTSSADIRAIADIVGINSGSAVLGGFETSSGSLRLPFGLLQWSSAGSAHSVGSVAAAEQATGLNVSLPSALPGGVGAPIRIVVQPEVTATIRFGAAVAGMVAGTSLTVAAGPAVLVEYGGSIPGLGLPTLGTFTMERPVASSVKSTPAQLEAFVLSRPGVPAGLAQEMRLLGDVATVLPVPTPPGVNVTQVDVSGSPAILVTDSSLGASGVIWEDRGGIVHAAVGLLDQKDILDVANQLG